MPAIAKVEPLTTARSLRGPFDYRIPGAMEGVEIGTMLVVPFGRRRLLGVVVGVAEHSEVPPERLVEPIAALESGVPAELVSLGLWLARDYCSTPARGLALVLPPGTGTASRGAPAARTKKELVARLTAAGRDALEPETAARLGSRQRAVLERLRIGEASASELRAGCSADHAALARLAKRGLVVLERRPIRRRPAPVELGGGPGSRDDRPPALGTRDGELSLTRVQEDALEAILDPLVARRHQAFLLHGVTGSGKTEVYLRAAAAALESGRSAIVLVPEIALTPQTSRRFRERFGGQVAVLHSKLGLGERYDEWQRLRRGDARICVGPRSAVFAPVGDLGLIVVDEEHDPAYKQEGDPRYDARRIAARRAHSAGAVLVSGSATPRPESWRQLERLALPERVDGRRLPPVELLDMRAARHALHGRTREALDEVKRSGSKAIVLVNRRGWAPFVVCRECGHTWKCVRCDVSLTLHRRAGEGQLVCHHCGHGEPAPGSCVSCGSRTVARHGVGTQRLEAELQAALAPMPIFRLDGDSAQRKHGVATLLRDFDQAHSGVLVGTQMVAQGHDFPEVSLAVVQDADSTLGFPDFRSEERTFSLVAQLAGRSGRGPAGGRVLVQTMSPETACLRHAARHDATAFLEEELERRRALSYPPFADLIRVVTASPDRDAAEASAAQVSEALDVPALEVLGPAPLFRLNDRFRSMVLVKASDRATAVAAVGEAVKITAAGRSPRGVSFSVDVDPQ